MLGFYDVCKKHAVHGNAVLPTLLVSTLACALVTLPFLVVSLVMPERLGDAWYVVTPMTARAHLLVAAKSVLVAGSWVLVYFAMKHLPLTVVSPVRASAPVWTGLAAFFVLGECPGSWQIAGILLAVTGFMLLARFGWEEGIRFHRNPWIFCLLGGTLLGAACALYDRALIHHLGFKPMTLQVWFAVYLVAVIGVLVGLLWWPSRRTTTPFTWRWSIPLVGVLLAVADFLYFTALKDPDAMIALVSPLRRSGVVVAFVVGGTLFREKNKRRKAVALAVILAGVFLLVVKR
jgi:drug/metabolite transporter (DMT)-like permease